MNVDRIAGAFIGVILGDTLGMPVEKLSHEEIMKLNDGQGVIDFMPSRDDGFRAYAAGDTTDDWQLTRAVIRSLIRTKGVLDIEDCAREHVAEWVPDTTTWGNTTHKAIQDIKEGKRKATQPVPRTTGKEGSGAGVVMKIAGLAAAAALRETHAEELDFDCARLGALTHGNPVAWVTAYAVAEIIRGRLMGVPQGRDSTSDLAIWIRSFTDDERTPDEETFIDHLERLDEMSVEEVMALPFPKFSAIYCTLLSIKIARKHGDDFRAGVLEAVNAGGDTDTDASIVGAIIGAGIGYNAVPDDWKNYRPEYAEAYTLAEELVDAIEE